MYDFETFDTNLSHNQIVLFYEHPCSLNYGSWVYWILGLEIKIFKFFVWKNAVDVETLCLPLKVSDLFSLVITPLPNSDNSFS